MNERYSTASQAAALLGVSRSSLYAYVSRGRVRAETDPKNPRASRYLTADIERLRDQKHARRHPEAAARKALQWGMPVLESAITLIEDGRLYYRGHDAVQLARRARFEDVVRLLWSAGDDDGPWMVQPLSPRCRGAIGQLAALAPMDRLQALLPIAESEDAHAFDTTADHVRSAGSRILNLLAAAATLDVGDEHPAVAAKLAAGWKTPSAAVRRLLDLALILCADHELNVSAFAVRVVASARSSLYAAVGAGLAAVRGSRHGGHTERIEDFLDEAGSPDRIAPLMTDRMRRGKTIPGFGHPLYPDGDPRATALLSAVAKLRDRSTATALPRAVERAGTRLLGEHPNLDYGLVVLRRALGLPRGAALLLFALGRSAGWIAHAMEQYASDALIRPRATYVGPRPRAPTY